MGYSPWGYKELAMTEATCTSKHWSGCLQDFQGLFCVLEVEMGELWVRVSEGLTWKHRHHMCVMVSQ